MTTTFPAAPPSALWRPLVAVPTSPAWAKVPRLAGHMGMGDGTPEDILRLPSFHFFFFFNFKEPVIVAVGSQFLGLPLGPPPHTRFPLGVSEFAHPSPYTVVITTPKPSLATHPTRSCISHADVHHQADPSEGALPHLRLCSAPS